MPTGIYGSSDSGIPLDITKDVILNYGSVAILYAANNDNYNPETYAWYNDEYENTNHVVTIVGWDDNYPKENFNSDKQPENDGAWLVRNSWGTDWGDEGYFWLSYEDKTTVAGNTYILEEADNYSNNYQYDTVGWSYSMPTNAENPKSATVANIFTAENDEQLEAVSFYTTDVGTSYSISIFTGVEEGQPQSGTLKLENQTGTEVYSGYHTIELDHPVKLNKGERFSIVIELENPNYTSPVAIELCITPTPDYVPQYLGNGGESYAFVNGEWFDICGSMADDAYVTNVCIKGFTNPLPDSDSAVSTVRFSEMEGPIPDGTEISLSANGTEEIYYSFDNSSYEKYTSPITIDFTVGENVTLYAYGVDNTGQPVAKNTKYVKRVIGLPGDTVTYKNNGELYVNGKYAPQTFISHKQRTTGTTSLNLPEAQGVRIGTGKSFKVPAGKYFVLGDNRAISNDSRYYGFVPRGKIDGVVKVPFWDANHRVINDYWKKVNQD